MALYARRPTECEKQEIEQALRSPSDDLPIHRLQIIILSVQRKRIPEISRRVGLHPINVRKWVHRFNEEGVQGLRSGKSPGRPPLFSEKQRQQIAKIAVTPPQRLGLHYSEWSLQRLRTYLVERGVVKHISVETVRKIIQSDQQVEPTGKAAGS